MVVSVEKSDVLFIGFVALHYISCSLLGALLRNIAMAEGPNVRMLPLSGTWDVVITLPMTCFASYPEDMGLDPGKLELSRQDTRMLQLRSVWRKQ